MIKMHGTGVKIGLSDLGSGSRIKEVNAVCGQNKVLLVASHLFGEPIKIAPTVRLFMRVKKFRNLEVIFMEFYI